jgi:hypothetical protein
MVKYKKIRPQVQCPSTTGTAACECVLTFTRRVRRAGGQPVKSLPRI